MGIFKSRLDSVREYKYYNKCGFFYTCKNGYEYFILVTETQYTDSLQRHINMDVNKNFKYFILERLDYSCVYNLRQLLEYAKNQMDDINQFKIFIENVKSYELRKD